MTATPEQRAWVERVILDAAPPVAAPVAADKPASQANTPEQPDTPALSMTVNFSVLAGLLTKAFDHTATTVDLAPLSKISNSVPESPANDDNAALPSTAKFSDFASHLDKTWAAATAVDVTPLYTIGKLAAQAMPDDDSSPLPASPKFSDFAAFLSSTWTQVTAVDATSLAKITFAAIR